MNLFISSSKSYLVKTLVIFLVLFILYEMVVQKLNPDIDVFQNQWIKNYSVAEAFIYHEPSFKAVIVGSSMAAKLKQKDLINKGIYNLSFEGGSSLTGLNIIKESHTIPKVIYIETNIIERKLNEDMLRSLFTPIIWKMKRHIISLRYTYQPINILLTVVNAKFGRGHTEKEYSPPDKRKLKLGIKRHRNSENSIESIDDQAIVSQKELVDYFSSKGSKIIFFEMPVHKEILSTKGYQKRKKVVLEVFSKHEFNWVDYKHGYETVDGIHLSSKSAAKYALVMQAYFDKKATSAYTH